MLVAGTGIAARIWHNRAVTTDVTPARHAIAGAFDAIDAAAADLWLRPEALLTGGAARTALAQGVALPLAGGTSCFTRVEVIARASNGDATALAPVRAVKFWASRLDAARRARIETQLARASDAR